MTDEGGNGGTLSGTGGAGGKPGTAGDSATGGTGIVAEGGRGGRGGSGGRATGVGGALMAGAGGQADEHCIAASAVEWLYTPQAGLVGTYATSLATSGIAANDAVVMLSLLSGDQGSFTLGKDDDANLATCRHCVRGKIWGLDGADRDFFADAGELVIDAASDTQHGVIRASLTGTHLAEVALDSNTGESTPVDGGFCIDLADGRVDVGTISTGGGEGGAAGASGAGNEGGAGGAAPLPTNCLEIGAGTWAEQLSPEEGEATYYTYLSPNVGSSARDLLGLLDYDDAVGTITFGHGDDASIDTCWHCMLVNIPNGVGDGRNFFALGGTLDISASSQPLAGVMEASFSDVTLVEVDADYHPLAGGDCLHLPSASFTLP
jgi:hypothetical protein